VDVRLSTVEKKVDGFLAFAQDTVDEVVKRVNGMSTDEEIY